MTLNKSQATTIDDTLELPAQTLALQQVMPYKVSLTTTAPTDLQLYFFYELINVYCTTIKSLIHEEFGDAIISAIDFKMDIQREAYPMGEHVKIVLNGTFLPYKMYLSADIF